MPPTCTPEKKNEYQNEPAPSESNELYFTTKGYNEPRTPEFHTQETDNDDKVKELTAMFPDLDRLFNLHNQVGHGTFSTVYLASLRADRKKQFAVKHIVPTCHPDRIKFELQCLTDIGGVDNVAGINLCLRNRNDVILIMPYQPHDFFNNYVGLMDITELACYMKNLLLALARVHSFGIVHRDIKPSNFLYDRKNKRFMLVDFGLAHSVQTAKDRKRKRDLLSPTSNDLSNPAKRPASQQILGASQKENDPDNKGKDVCNILGVSDVKPKNLEIKLTKPAQIPSKDAERKYDACRCYGRPKTCNACLTKKSLKALRAGTPGFRPPEVLLKSNEQNTGVDIWAAGIIMLSILSNCCNFFSSPDDMTALAEIVTVFGTEEIKRVASQLGRYLICSKNCPPLDLRKICCVLRARDKIANVLRDNNACSNCEQPRQFCVCAGKPLHEEIPDEFNAEAYDLLSKLLDVNVRTRISAGVALHHPFLRNVL